MKSIALVINSFLDSLHWVGYIAMPVGAYVAGLPVWLRTLGVVWGLSHVCFEVYWKHKLGGLKRRELVSGPEERRESLMRAIEDFGELQPLLEPWLIKRPSGPIGAAYFLEWLTWITFDKSVEQLTEKEKEEVATYMQILEKRMVQPSQEFKMQPFCTMRPSIDDFKMELLPLVVYSVVWCMRESCIVALKMVGFERHQEGDVRYLHRQPVKEEGTPIMFIHGISAGFVPYVMMLVKLANQFPHRQIILLEVPHIAMELTTAIPDRGATLDAIDAIATKHGILKFSLSAHSYGTLMASWIIRNRPSLVAKLSLVDPVCFRLWDATLAHNFLYAKPISFMHDLIRNFVTKEYLITHSVSREVYWSQMVLFPSDITVPTTVIISTKDWVINPSGCYEYLKPHISNIHLINTFHGGFGFSQEFTHKFLNSL
ncbi:hypothetical protein DSO57_1025626 [Entomophthora muscae]|uniref:Uncharacterized protein n=1 Tax=Entomophthora muscae TaxID=34485 RepID=A0ACC2UBD6_9FUNG|nr:hypothetical protein DSO57_1025626 [Entomophthora muscae]